VRDYGRACLQRPKPTAERLDITSTPSVNIYCPSLSRSPSSASGSSGFARLAGLREVMPERQRLVSENDLVANPLTQLLTFSTGADRGRLAERSADDILCKCRVGHRGRQHRRLIGAKHDPVLQSEPHQSRSFQQAEYRLGKADMPLDRESSRRKEEQPTVPSRH
jgi:hypothetical protein